MTSLDTNHKKKLPKLINGHHDWHFIEFSAATLVLAFLVGFSLSLPFNLIKKKEVKPSMLGSRQELITQIMSLTKEKDDLKDALTKEREQLGVLEQSFGQKQKESDLALGRFREASLLAGLRAVKGQGIVLTLAESHESIPADDEVASYLIHQEDLLNITNELWAAGAEALAIKSGNSTERIVAATAIRCVGPVVQVNNQAMAPPFEILAIGDSQRLRQALEMPGGVLQPLTYFKITYTIEEKPEIIIPPYSGALTMTFAQPVEEITEDNQ